MEGKMSSYRVFLSIERKTVTSAVGTGSPILLKPLAGTWRTTAHSGPGQKYSAGMAARRKQQAETNTNFALI